MSRENLPHDLAARLRGRITSGAMAAGSRINEVDLARLLEVSRTPLREALSRLAAEDLLEVRPRRGFFVRGPGAAEVRELGEVRALLEPAALAAAGALRSGELVRLARLNAATARAAGDVERVIELAEAWRGSLLSGCPNGVLLEAIERAARRTRAVERAWARERVDVEATVREHGEVVAALSRDDVAGAAVLQRAAVEGRAGRVAAWLEGTLRHG